MTIFNDLKPLHFVTKGFKLPLSHKLFMFSKGADRLVYCILHDFKQNVRTVSNVTTCLFSAINYNMTTFKIKKNKQITLNFCCLDFTERLKPCQTIID